MIEGKNTIIFTDHKSIIYAFNQNPTKVSPRQQRQLEFISQFSADIRHVNGANNNVVDALSRVHYRSLYPLRISRKLSKQITNLKNCCKIPEHSFSNNYD